MASVWFLTRTLSPTDIETSSTVNVPPVVKSIFPVDAAITESLTSKPWIRLSTYALVVTWLAFDGADDEVIFTNVGLFSEPKPRADLAPPALLEPVPPLTIGNTPDTWLSKSTDPWSMSLKFILVPFSCNAPVKLMLPDTSNVYSGLVVPIPTLPFDPITKLLVPISISPLEEFIFKLPSLWISIKPLADSLLLTAEIVNVLSDVSLAVIVRFVEFDESILNGPVVSISIPLSPISISSFSSAIIFNWPSWLE